MMATKRRPLDRKLRPEVTPQVVALYESFLAARNEDKRNAIAWEIHSALHLMPWDYRPTDVLRWKQNPWPHNAACWERALELQQALDAGLREAKQRAREHE